VVHARGWRSWRRGGGTKRCWGWKRGRGGRGQPGAVGGEVRAGRRGRAWGVVAAHKRHARGKGPTQGLGAKPRGKQRDVILVLSVCPRDSDGRSVAQKRSLGFLVKNASDTIKTPTRFRCAAYKCPLFGVTCRGKRAKNATSSKIDLI
jgi:hypothetical protein